MMKMKLQFFVATIVCMELRSVRSNNKLNPNQSGVQGNIYNLFDSIGKSDVEKTNIYRNILAEEAVREDQAFNTMKDELWLTRRRNADKPADHHLTRYNIKKRATQIWKPKEPGICGIRTDDSLSALELAAMGDFKRLKLHLDGYSENKQEFLTLLHILLLLVGFGYLDIIQYIVQKKPSILEIDCPWSTPNCKLELEWEILQTAVERGRLNVVRFMVEEEPLLWDRFGYTANSAASNGHQDILLYMLDKKPDSVTGYVLTSAAKKNILTVKILKVLEAKGLFVRATVTKFGKEICLIAAHHDNLDLVKYFVEEDPSYLSATNGNFQWNITYYAVRGPVGGHDVFWYMIGKDPSVLMRKDEKGNYPLLLAISQNIVNSRQLENLVQKYGVPLGETNNKGETMAYVAAKCNNLDIIAYIGEKESTILNKRSNHTYSDTVAGIAASQGYWDIVKYLAKKNPSVYTEMTGTGESILYMCVKKDLLDRETLKWLLKEEKIPLNLRETVDNRSLAQWALENKNHFIFKYLVTNELSLMYQRVNGSKTGPTIAHLAIQKGFLTWGSQIIPTAVEKTPSIFAQKDDSNNSNSVLHVAIEQGLIDIEMLEKLLNGKHVSLSETNEKGDTLAHAAAAAPDRSHYQLCWSKIQDATSKQAFPGDKVTSPQITDADADKAHIIKYIATKQASLLAQKNNDGENVAHVAAKKGHVNTLKIIATVCSLSILQTTDRRENSALHLLATAAKLIESSPLEYFKILVEKGVPIMGINFEGETAAHIAARSGLFEIVQYMVQKEPKLVQKKNSVGQTIAFTAAVNAHCDIIRFVGDKDLLLERDYNGNTIFHLIMESNSRNDGDFYDTFQSIDIPVDLLVKPNDYGMSAAHLAAKVGCGWIIERIAAKNPRILVESDRNGISAFSNAVRHQQASIVQIILAKNTKLETQQILLLFQLLNERELLNIVLQMEKNAGWNRTHFDGIAIHSAIESGYWSILKHFMETRKVDVNQLNSKGEPPIFTATRCKHFDMLKYLVEQRGADLLKTDDRGNNIIFVAMENDDLSTMKYVLDEMKAPIDVNKVGDSILHGDVIRDSVKDGAKRRMTKSATMPCK